MYIWLILNSLSEKSVGLYRLFDFSLRIQVHLCLLRDFKSRLQFVDGWQTIPLQLVCLCNKELVLTSEHVSLSSIHSFIM